MATIRRYGPAGVAPAVTPRPELGRGREAQFAAFGGMFQAAEEFVRPAVEEAQKVKGEQEALEELDGKGLDATFEPRSPFTVRSQAFNGAAEKVISTRASEAMQGAMINATRKADGDLNVLKVEMDKARSDIMAALPEGLLGIASDVETQYERGRVVAERNTADLARRRVVARQRAAAAQALDFAQSEAERLALIGATGPELSDHMAQAADQIAQFGPRGEFTLAGKTYPADPSRSGILSPGAMEDRVRGISTETSRIMLEADFQQSEAPGQFVEEFRAQVFSGNSPFSAGESLEMLRRMDTRARTMESQRRTAANAERDRLEAGMDTAINGYVTMTEAGVPMAIPEEERVSVLDSLSPFPDMQREARLEFAVADAQVETHGMTGAQLNAYAGRIRGDMEAAASRGELDLEGAAVLASLEDRLAKVQDAVSSETLGLPMVEQLAMDGAAFEDVDYDALRTSANGNEDILREIAEVEAFHRDTEQLQNMTTAQRETVLEAAREGIANLAARGRGLGADALITQGVLDRLDEWSTHRAELAATDPVKFAAASGVALPSFEGVESMTDAGAIIAARVGAVAPLSSAEGVDNPVPLTQAEVDALSEIYSGSTRGEKSAFLGSIAALGEDQAMAVFARMGQAEPTLFAAGAVYTMGNQQAAGVILRGSVDTKLDGGSRSDLAAAREVTLGALLEVDMLAPEGIEMLDTTALAYARGLAMAEGGRQIETRDMEAGYNIALGQQADGTGGFADTRYGPTILPSGWTARRLDRTLRRLTPMDMNGITQGIVQDRYGRPFDAEEILPNVHGLRPSPDDPNVLVPVDREGAFFLVNRGHGEALDVLTFDLSELGQE